MPVEVLLHDAFEIAHTASPQLGVPESYSHGVSGAFGLHLQRATFFNGEENVGEDSLGGDGEVAQGAAAQSTYGAGPGDKVAGLACPCEIHRKLLSVHRSGHTLRVHRSGPEGAPWYTRKALVRAKTSMGLVRTYLRITTPLLTGGRLKHKATLFMALVSTLGLVVLISGCSFGSNEPGPRDQNVAQEAPEVSADVPEDEPVARVAAQVGPSVVQVNVQAIQLTPFGAQQAQGLGSGVIYRRDGYIITNNHVVQNASEVNVAFADGSTERGEVVGADPSTEIAVVRVDRDDLPAAKFAEGSPTVGQLAVAIGSPSGFQSTVTEGVISGLNREVPGRLTGGQQEAALVDLIQTDAAISPGSSGGALVDRSGEVVGINVAYLPPETRAESIGFAIPSKTATSVADQLIENGRVSNPFLGVRGLRDLTPDIARQFGLSVETGAIFAEVVPGGPADDAGLRSGDVIIALGSTEISDSGDLIAALRDYRPGDDVTLTVVRGGKGNEEKVTVELGELPQR